MADQTKVILWACPRTVSSAFLKCMSGVPDSKMLFEMFTTSRLYGPEAGFSDKKTQMPSASAVTCTQEDPGSGFNSSICTYEWVKHHMETAYPDKKLVFSKELPYCIAEKFDYLPDSGYRHAFLIRNPAKVIPSWTKIMAEMMTLLPQIKQALTAANSSEPTFTNIIPIYKTMYELYSHIQEKGMDTDPVIIDSDDLLNDPASVLSSFCKQLGIPYSDALLSWEPGVEVVENWTVSQDLIHVIKHTDSFKNFRTNSCFLKPTPKAEPEVSAEMQHLIDVAMPYYTEMYEKRMK